MGTQPWPCLPSLSQLGALAAATHLFTHRKERRAGETAVAQQSVSGLSSREDLSGRGLREQAEHESRLSYFSVAAPCSHWSPACLLSRKLVRLVGWEFSESTPCYSGSFGVSNYAGWNAPSLFPTP